MDTAKTIKELRESTGMSRTEFSEHTGIPVRTLEDWEAGRRTPPEYVERYNIFRGRLLIRHASSGKKYLYDILEIKKETGKSCQT